jgi:hypothetical protein
MSASTGGRQQPRWWAAPFLFLVDNLLHPKEFTRDHEPQQLAKIGESYTRWQLAHTIGFLALIVFAAACSASRSWSGGTARPSAWLPERSEPWGC